MLLFHWKIPVGGIEKQLIYYSFMMDFFITVR